MGYHDAGPVAFGRFRRYEKGFPDRATRAIGKGGVNLGYRSDVALRHEGCIFRSGCKQSLSGLHTSKFGFILFSSRVSLLVRFVASPHDESSDLRPFGRPRKA